MINVFTFSYLKQGKSKAILIFYIMLITFYKCRQLELAMLEN